MRYSVTLLGEFVLLARFSQTSCLIPSIKILFERSRFSRWKSMIYSFCRISFHSLSCHLWLLLPLLELFVYAKNYWVTKTTHFLPLGLLHCYSQIASIFTFYSDSSVKLLLLNLRSLRSIATKKLLAKVVVPKPQSLILLVTRRYVLLVHFTVYIVPISPLFPRMTWIFILLKSTSPKKLSLLPSVNIVSESF